MSAALGTLPWAVFSCVIGDVVAGGSDCGVIVAGLFVGTRGVFRMNAD
jgi:hypothetical protein